VVIIKAEGKSFSAGTDLEERLIDELISIFMASIKTAKQNKGKPS
jgi:enoyl-CoA hydratase/carnithine racemase